MNYKDNYSKLLEHEKKTITKDELEKLLGFSDSEELYTAVSQLQAAGVLQPVKNSKTNGNILYPVFLKYKLCLVQDDFSEELDEINALHPQLHYDGILHSRPAEYRKYRKELRKLDSYLFFRHTSCIPVSRKERSFEIFSREKLLDDTGFRRLLEKLNLNQETLLFYDTPEYCFNDFIPEKKPEMTLLICENKDIWFNIRRRMFEDQASEILGTPIDGVVYGAGNQISEKKALTSYTRFMGDTHVSYLYWGDIDRAGLNIYLSLLKNNPDLKISLFKQGYEEMLRLSTHFDIPDSDDKRELMGDYSEIYKAVSNAYRDLFKENILHNKRIPQEIITYADLLKIMR